jgi:acyl-CoA dehydrogenase
MDFEPTERAREIHRRAEQFLHECVYPAEPTFAEQVAQRPEAWDAPPVMAELTKQARERGLWNLFLPDGKHGAGLSNVEYAPVAELTGRSPALAPARRNSRSAGCVRCWTARSGPASR